MPFIERCKPAGLAVRFGDRTKMPAVYADLAGQTRASFASGHASGAILEPLIFRLEETCLVALSLKRI